MVNRIIRQNDDSGKKGNEGVIAVYKEMIKEGIAMKEYSVKSLQTLKNKVSSQYKIAPAANVDLISAYYELLKSNEITEHKEFLKLIRKRGVRSKSGIVNVTILTKAFGCPGKCIFCPSEPLMPKSYLSNEPAMMRAVLNKFNAYKQVENRLFSLKTTGHFTDKVDVIISGGTFSFYPKKYQTAFVRSMYNALNAPSPAQRSLIEAQRINETANNRCIGLSVETRPDMVTKEEVRRFRKLGCTKIEIGVQSLDDEVLAINKRGHGIEEVKRSMQLLKDAAFKVNVHMMPNLLGSTPEKDLRDMKELFENPDYRPDWLKVYPCMVVPWSQLEKIFNEGGYQSYDDETLVNLMVEMHKVWPEYVRVTRVYRDIPADTIISGCKYSNLRQVVEKRMSEQGIYSRDIRSREIKDMTVQFDELALNVKEFEASRGQEFFISYDHSLTDKLCALLRLRFSSYSLTGRRHFIPELEGAALVREVHTYGEQVKIANKEGNVSQHIGLGRRMMQQAEDIAKKNGYKKVAVISGIGVREYYRKLGYERVGTYMIKDI